MLIRVTHYFSKIDDIILFVSSVPSIRYITRGGYENNWKFTIVTINNSNSIQLFPLLPLRNFYFIRISLSIE